MGSWSAELWYLWDGCKTIFYSKTKNLYIFLFPFAAFCLGRWWLAEPGRSQKIFDVDAFISHPLS
jgi:hypothetical protein